LSTQPTPLFDMSKAKPIFDMSKAEPIVGATQQQEETPSTYEKLTASYNPDVEEWAQKHPIAGPILRFLDATGGAALSTPEAIVKGISDVAQSYMNPSRPTEIEKTLTESAKGWADPKIRAGALSVLPEALGMGAGATAGSEFIPTGAAGTVRGGKALGRATMESLTPSKASLLKAAEIAKHPTEIPGRIFEAAVNKIPEPPTFPGASLPAAEEFYAARASDLMKRSREQFLLDAKAAREAKAAAKNAPAPSPFAGMTSSASPGGANLQLPAPVPQGSPSLFQQSKAQFVSKLSAPEAEPSRIISPEEAAKPLRVEGSYWSFKESALRTAVLGGDREAAIVYKQRFGQLPSGAGYLTDIGQGPTRGLYRSKP